MSDPVEKLRILLVPYNKEPEVVEIEHKLENVQALVGGMLEVVPVGDGVDVWCNEEFLMLYEAQPNRVVQHVGGYPVQIHGPFFVARTNDDGDTVSLTDTDVAKYSRVYRL